MQVALTQFASQLPPGTARVVDILRLGMLTGQIVEAEALSTVKTALKKAEEGLTRFLRGPGVPPQ
jgi:hypothetical protein